MTVSMIHYMNLWDDSFQAIKEGKTANPDDMLLYYTGKDIEKYGVVLNAKGNPIGQLLNNRYVFPCGNRYRCVLFYFDRISYSQYCSEHCVRYNKFSCRISDIPKKPLFFDRLCF